MNLFIPVVRKYDMKVLQIYIPANSKGCRDLMMPKDSGVAKGRGGLPRDNMFAPTPSLKVGNIFFLIVWG